MKKILCGMICLLICSPLISISLGHTTENTSISMNATTTGLQIHQVDFRFKKVIVNNSNWGTLEININEFLEQAGRDEGYLNIMTDTGWVLQNQFINKVKGHTNLSIDFNLGNKIGTVVRSLSLHMAFAPKPVVTFEDGPRDEFPVDDVTYNAEGCGDSETTYIGEPMPYLSFDINMPNFNYTKPYLPGENVQCATNQCYPMAVANSLQYLEDNYQNIVIPNDHVPGLYGDTSLVGQLDFYSGRYATNRTSGGGVNNLNMVYGKFEYLDAIGMGSEIEHRHQGYNGGISPGDITHAGIVSYDDSVNGNVTFSWLYDRLKECADVEIGYFRVNASGNVTGGHAIRVIGCGKTAGQPWIRYIHDGQQTGSDPNDQYGLNECQVYIADLDRDGFMNMGCNTSEIGFALAETPKAVNITMVSGGLAIIVGIKNSGPLEKPNLPWSIVIEAPFILFGGSFQGTVDLPAHKTVQITTKMTVGFGFPQIKIIVGHVQRTYRGILLGPIVIPLRQI